MGGVLRTETFSTLVKLELRLHFMTAATWAAGRVLATNNPSINGNLTP